MVLNGNFGRLWTRFIGTSARTYQRDQAGVLRRALFFVNLDCVDSTYMRRYILLLTVFLVNWLP